MKPVYLDYNATTPIDPEVLEAMRPYLEKHFGNPSSSHWYGAQAKDAIEKARSQMANLLNCRPGEIIFTGSGTESNNCAIKGAVYAHADKGNHLIISSIEHAAVTEVCRYLETRGFPLSYIPVDEKGIINLSALEKTIMPETVLISVMHANNEVGTIEPIREITALARKKGIMVHTDAAQSMGKTKTDVEELGVDLLSIAGHKMYAPKGIGALYIREGIGLEKFMHGAGHERNMRAGTENVPYIVGLGKACEIAKRDLTKNTSHMKKMRDRLFEGLQERLGDIRLNGHPEKCIPNTLSVGFPNIDATFLLSEMTNVAASAGSACHAGSTAISGVLGAMGVPQKYAMGTIRLSVGKMTTEDEIDRSIESICKAVERIRLSMR
ncbi:MAG: cysteine desulfurase [Deltaproteobacteria bacterium]|nr:cysteine desulfurase [Deltaproteobacteria bacterium]MBN2846307.1 cysteine desulfurase [Deltaproteobacteria bacterium]